MPRFFFDWYDGERFMRDEEGVDLHDFKAAQREAVQGLSEAARIVFPSTEQRDLGITVRDAAGIAIFATTLVFETRRLADWH